MAIIMFQSGFRRRKSSFYNFITLETSILLGMLCCGKHFFYLFFIWRKLVILPGSMVCYLIYIKHVSKVV